MSTRRHSAQDVAARAISTSIVASPTTAEPLRILMVTARYLPDIGGTEVHTKELAERLAALGHDVTVLTTDLWDELPGVEWTSRVRIRRVRAWPADRDYYFAPSIFRIVTRGRWDIVHCQGYHTLVAPITMLAAWRARIPFVVSFHSGGHSSAFRRAIRGMQRRALRPLLARAHRLVGGSTFEAQYFEKKLGLPSEKFAVVPVVAHLPVVTAPDPESDGTTLLVSIGRLERYKGHHRAIEAMPLVIEQVPNARLRVVGDGPYESELWRLAEELGVDDDVEIKSIPLDRRDEMAHLLHRASLVISLSEYESAGLAVREALAARRQALLLQTSALTELAESPLVQQIPMQSTKEQIARAIVEQLRRPAIADAARNPTWDSCVAAYDAIYRAAVRDARCVS
ncbi:MAG TPA: glycosyltransferase family 4 protein [Thermomicrobiales bacterium]|jgi:glycosyltransferase involved in cell wall biosynthesis